MPVVAKVRLKSEALAKSYRPNSLFSVSTCPQIALGEVGQLLVSCTKEGLEALKDRLLQGDSKTLESNISTVERIDPWTSEDALSRREVTTVFEALKYRNVYLRLSLFNHRNKRINESLISHTMQLLDEMHISYEMSPIDSRRGCVALNPSTPDQISKVARLVSAQSLTPAARLRPLRPLSAAWEDATEDHLPPPEVDRAYPILGIVDTGICIDEALMAPWIVGREEFVPEEFQDNVHGTFVGALAINPEAMNADDRFHRTPCRLLDVVAIPEDGVTDDQLISILEDVLPRYPEIKVWNLSIGDELPCDSHLFSFLGTELDRLQDQHDVLFVIAAGNIADPPYRAWATKRTIADHRISAPADSVRGLAVGSVAHKHNNRSLSKPGEPSPFSRCGPGPAFLPKPELVLIGGNCDKDGKFAQTGVLSLDDKSALVEDIGTSFAAPQVAALAANIGQALQPAWNRRLVKALLVHSAALKSGRILAADLPYFGFGSPPDVRSVLSTPQNATTLLFEPELEQGVEWQIVDFPIPPCLFDGAGKFVGEITMTLVYHPHLDTWAGAEYCRANVDIAFGTIFTDKGGEERFRGQVPPEPREMKALYEHHMVEQGFKWSPVKVYRRRIPNGIKDASRWRLAAKAYGRDGFELKEPLPITLLLTLSALDDAAHTYDEMVQELTKGGRIHQPLRVSSEIELRLD